DLGERSRLAHRRVCRALTPAVDSTSRDWSRVDEYTRRHLTGHAAACGDLDQLVLDPGFLLTVPTPDLLRHRHQLHTSTARSAVGALELAANSWTGMPDQETWLYASAHKLRCRPLITALD